MVYGLGFRGATKGKQSCRACGHRYDGVRVVAPLDAHHQHGIFAAQLLPLYLPKYENPHCRSPQNTGILIVGILRIESPKTKLLIVGIPSFGNSRTVGGQGTEGASCGGQDGRPAPVFLGLVGLFRGSGFVGSTVDIYQKMGGSLSVWCFRTVFLFRALRFEGLGRSGSAVCRLLFLGRRGYGCREGRHWLGQWLDTREGDDKDRADQQLLRHHHGAHERPSTPKSGTPNP